MPERPGAPLEIYAEQTIQTAPGLIEILTYLLTTSSIRVKPHYTRNIGVVRTLHKAPAWIEVNRLHDNRASDNSELLNRSVATGVDIHYGTTGRIVHPARHRRRVRQEPGGSTRVKPGKTEALMLPFCEDLRHVFTNERVNCEEFFFCLD